MPRTFRPDAPCRARRSPRRTCRNGNSREHASAASAYLRRGPRPAIPVRTSIAQYTSTELIQLLRWIASDGQLRTDDRGRVWFTPPRADKSKRLEGTLYQFTVTRGLTTEIKDAAVERIRQVCSGALFARLFKVVTKFKLADGATQVLAGRLPADTPRNLRALFSRAVETKETTPRLRVEKIEAEYTASAAAAQ